MTFANCRCTLLALGLLLAAPLALAVEVIITWPAGWEVESLPDTANAAVHRQRAAFNDANGDPQMVVELTRTALAVDHQVNLGGVVLEMRKALQVNFSHGGYQSVCTKVHDARLGDIAAVETTCKISLNGGHVMTQTLVAASTTGAAYSLSYAGSAQGYEAHVAEVQAIRDGLRLQLP